MSNAEEGWRGFLALCNQCKTPEKLEELFELFLTLEEKDDLAKRYLLVRGLLKGKKTQRQLARELGVGIATVTRGSNALKSVNKKLKEKLCDSF